MRKNNENVGKLTHTGHFNKGITLVALIVTIIILLILAGITISQLAENELLKKAKLAENETKNAQGLENLILKEYENEVESALKSGDNSIIDGNVPKVNYYGKIVNYKSKIDDTLVWKIFYIDDESVYLISETFDGKAPITNFNINNELSNYKSGADVSEKGKKLNSLLVEKGTFFVESNANSNIKATVYLTDTTKWVDYLDTNDITSNQYAIGSLTCELFMNSYNETHENKIVLSAGNFGYYGMANYTIDHMCNDIYYHNNSSILFASPNNSDAYYGYIMPIIPSSGNLYYMGLNWTGNAVNLKPIVCIPKGKFNYEFVD